MNKFRSSPVIEIEKLINIFCKFYENIFPKKDVLCFTLPHTAQCESHRNVPIEFWTLIFRTVVFHSAAGDIT